MTYERIDDSATFDGKVRDSHELRYHIAKGFVADDDFVLDAGCGTGYGIHILGPDGYIGIDKNPPNDQSFIQRDLEQPVDDVVADYDVFVGFEIIEHLDPVEYFVQLAKLARKWIVVSTPIVPNSNPYHKQQFTEADMLGMFVDETWQHYGTLTQDGIYGIFIFKKS